MVAFQNPQRLGIESKLRTLLVERIDPRKERWIEENRIPMPGNDRRQIALDALQGLIGIGRAELRENQINPIKLRSTAFERRNRVVKARGAGIADNG